MCSISILYIINSIILEIMDEEDYIEDGIYDEIGNEDKGQTVED